MLTYTKPRKYDVDGELFDKFREMTEKLKTEKEQKLSPSNKADSKGER